MGNAQLISFGLSTLLRSTRPQNMWLKCWHPCLWFSFLARISDLRDLQEARLSVSSRFPQIFPSLIAGSQIPIFWLPPRGCYIHSWTITSGHLMAHYDFSLLATQPSCSLSLRWLPPEAFHSPTFPPLWYRAEFVLNAQAHCPNELSYTLACERHTEKIQ